MLGTSDHCSYPGLADCFFTGPDEIMASSQKPRELLLLLLFTFNWAPFIAPHAPSLAQLVIGGDEPQTLADPSDKF